MPYKKFNKSDIFVSTIKTRPNFQIKFDLDGVYYTNTDSKFFDINLNTEDFYRYISRDSSLYMFDTSQPTPAGEIQTGKYPLSSSVTTYFFSENSNRPKIYSLRNCLNRNTIRSRHFSFSSSLGDKSKQPLTLIDIPSLIFGSSIEPGTMKLGFYLTGTLVSKIEDTGKNGLLVTTTGSNLGNVAGMVLYEEGIAILTGSWDLGLKNQSGTPIYTGWVHWGNSISNLESNYIKENSSFSLEFNGINYVQSITMLAHADKGELNHSNNLTYIKRGELSSSAFITSSNMFSEPSYMQIKNTVDHGYEEYSGSLEKQTFISKIALYDEKKNLIAIAKVSKPIRKTENRDFTFKLKMDI